MRLRLPRTTQPPDPEWDAYERVSGSNRLGGCLAGFIPLGLFTYMMAFGIGMSSPGPPPKTPIGKWLGQSGVITLPFHFTLACAVLGFIWILGVPRRKKAALRYLLGTALLGLIATAASMSGDVDPSLVPFTFIAAGLILSAFVYARS